MTGVFFDLSSVFSTVANAIPEHTALVWRDLRLSYAQINARIDGVAHYLTSVGLGCHTERDRLAGHESGQDHIGLYLRNGNQYLETMVAAYRARVAPFNVSYRYVEDELIYLLNDSKATALAYNAEFAPRVAAIRDQLPHLKVLIQVADHTGNELLPGAVDYESVVSTPAPAMPTPTGDDLYILYTGGTTGMPKGVLWRQHDIFVSAMGRTPVRQHRGTGLVCRTRRARQGRRRRTEDPDAAAVHARRRAVGGLQHHHHGRCHRHSR
jgi:acyl-CoA synthetase (AMP-forming)/AMP-acid ligase II